METWKAVKFARIDFIDEDRTRAFFDHFPFEGMIQTRGGKLEILSRDEYVLKSSFFLLLNFENSNFEEEFAKVREE